MAVSRVSKAKRDKRYVPYSVPKKKDGRKTFSQLLQEAASGVAENNLECCTTTYGRDSRMQSFLYQTREYHY